MKLKIKHDTWLKTRIASSTELWNYEKVLIAKGLVDIVKVSPSINKCIRIELVNSVLSADSKTKIKIGYLYRDHTNYQEVSTDRETKLSVPYFSQVENSTIYSGPGSKQSKITTLAMLLEYLLPGKIGELNSKKYFEFENEYGSLISKYGKPQTPQEETKPLIEYGINSYFSYNLNMDDLEKSILRGMPVLIGVNYKMSGHWVIVCGLNRRSNLFYVHDPYGVRLGFTSSYEPNFNGSYQTYSKTMLERTWQDLGKEAGWGRIITSVNGEKTGL